MSNAPNPPGGGYPPPASAPQQAPGGAIAQPAGAPPGPPMEIGEVIANFKVLIKRTLPGVLTAFLLLAAIRFVFSVPGWAITYLEIDALSSGTLSDVSTYSIVGGCAGVLSTVVSLLVCVLMVGLYRPMRMLMVGGPGAVGKAGDVLRIARERFVHTLGAVLLSGLACAVGLLACGVGSLVAAYFVALAAYFVTAVDVEIPDAFKRSVELAKDKANLVPLLSLIGLAIVALLVAWGVGAVFSMVAVMVLGLAGAVLGSVVMFVLFTVASYVMLVYGASVAITIEAKSAGLQLQV